MYGWRTGEIEFLSEDAGDRSDGSEPAQEAGQADGEEEETPEKKRHKHADKGNRYHHFRYR